MKNKFKNVFIHPSAEVSDEAEIGEGTKIWNTVQVREKAKIGKQCILGKNVYIDIGTVVGDKVKIQNNVSIFQGITIEDGVFLGPHVCFTNDKLPRAINYFNDPKSFSEWAVFRTLVKKGTSIGANCTILPGLVIGEFSLIGAGSVVTKNVPPYAIYYGNPAKLSGYVCQCGLKITDKCSICKMTIQDVRNAKINFDRNMKNYKKESYRNDA